MCHLGGWCGWQMLIFSGEIMWNHHLGWFKYQHPCSCPSWLGYDVINHHVLAWLSTNTPFILGCLIPLLGLLKASLIFLQSSTFAMRHPINSETTKRPSYFVGWIPFLSYTSFHVETNCLTFIQHCLTCGWFKYQNPHQKKPWKIHGDSPTSWWFSQ